MCEKGELVDNVCVGVSNVARTWTDARTACKNDGGRIAQVDNVRIQRKVQDLMRVSTVKVYHDLYACFQYSQTALKHSPNHIADRAKNHNEHSTTKSY